MAMSGSFWSMYHFENALTAIAYEDAHAARSATHLLRFGVSLKLIQTVLTTSSAATSVMAITAFRLVTRTEQGCSDSNPERSPSSPTEGCPQNTAYRYRPGSDQEAVVIKTVGGTGLNRTHKP